MRPLRRAPAPGTGKEGSAGDEDAPTDASVPAPSAVGVAEVSKEAGLTHGALYAHFPSKEALEHGLALADARMHQFGQTACPI